VRRLIAKRIFITRPPFSVLVFVQVFKKVFVAFILEILVPPLVVFRGGFRLPFRFGRV
jgi:hypothetical protein